MKNIFVLCFLRVKYKDAMINEIQLMKPSELITKLELKTIIES